MLGQVRRVEPYCKYKGKKKHHNKQQVRQYSLTNKKRSKKRKPLTRSKIRGKYRSKRRRRRKGRRKERSRRRKDRKLRVWNNKTPQLFNSFWKHKMHLQNTTLSFNNILLLLLSHSPNRSNLKWIRLEKKSKPNFFIGLKDFPFPPYQRVLGGKSDNSL